ncbi:hypothetical protein [Nocardia gipuzkoensis]
MTERHPTTRALQPPRHVLVDPRRVWVPSARKLDRLNPVTLGEKAAALNLRLGEQWIPARAYRWARLGMGTEPTWYLEIEVELRTNNGLTEITLRQWVPWDAVRPE